MSSSSKGAGWNGVRPIFRPKLSKRAFCWSRRESLRQLISVKAIAVNRSVQGGSRVAVHYTSGKNSVIIVSSQSKNLALPEEGGLNG